MKNQTDISLQKIPPHDLEAEQRVLGAIFKENSFITKALAIITSSDFYRGCHQKIFACMVKLFEISEVIDLLTIADGLRKAGELEICGGVKYLGQVEEAIPTATAIEYHSKIIKEKSIKRFLIKAGVNLIEKSYSDQEEAINIINEIQKQLLDINISRKDGSLKETKIVIGSAFDIIEKLYEKKTSFPGVSTGYKEIDKITSGLQKSDYILLAGRPGMGKTTLALDIAKNVAIKEKLPVAFFSLEMAQDSLGIKMICAQSKLSFQKIRSGYIGTTDWSSLTNAAGVLSDNNKIFIDDSPALTPLQILIRTQRLEMEIKRKVGLIIVDHLQLMRCDEKKSDNRNMEITYISRALKDLAKTMNVPLLVLSQLSRDMEKRGGGKRPLPSDLRDSGSLEQDADLIAFIYRDDFYNDDSDEKGIAEIIIAKQRMGPVGVCKIMFRKEIPCFENLATYPGEDLL